LVAIGSILPSIVHGKICNDRLLQLIASIQLMKNEVKKKMHAKWRAMVYQSYRETAVKQKISAILHQNTSRACHRVG